MVDGCGSKLIYVVSGVPQDSVFGQLLFLLYTSELLFVMENDLIGYADDSLCYLLRHPQALESGDGAIAESLNRDLGKVSEWCDVWGIKFNVSRPKTMIVSRSRTIHSQSSQLTIGGLC